MLKLKLPKMFWSFSALKSVRWVTSARLVVLLRGRLGRRPLPEAAGEAGLLNGMS